MKLLIFTFGLILFSIGAQASEQKFNIVLLTVDDMSADSIGAFGAQVKDITPNIDKFAQDSFRFHYAHVHATSCIPSRNAISSGRYLYNSGVEGFLFCQRSKSPFKLFPMSFASRVTSPSFAVSLSIHTLIIPIRLLI